MPHWTVHVQLTSDSSAAAFTRADWLQASTSASLSRAVASGRATRLLTGVYAPTAHADSWHVKAQAALAWAGPSAALAGASALWVWGLIPEAPTTVALAVRPDLRLHSPTWLRLHRYQLACGLDRADGFPVLGAPEAIIRGYAKAPANARAELVYRAVRNGLATPEDLHTLLGRLRRVSMRRELATRIGAATAGAESFLEERALRTVFTADGLTGMIPQHTVSGRGWRYRLDLYEPRTRTAFELDGSAYHANPAAHQRDRERDARLASIGIQTVRFGYRDVVDRPEWCREIAVSVLANRGLRQRGGVRERRLGRGIGASSVPQRPLGNAASARPVL